MGNLLHANAKTMHRIRKEKQSSVESASNVSERYNLNIKNRSKVEKN